MDFKGIVDSSVETKKYFDDEYVIDLKALFLEFKALWHYIVICALVGGILGMSYFSFLSNFILASKKSEDICLNDSLYTIEYENGEAKIWL